MAMPMDINDSGQRQAKYDMIPVEMMRNDARGSPPHRDTTLVIHSILDKEPIGPVYGQNTMPPKTIFERFEDAMDGIKDFFGRNCCNWCRTMPGFVILLLFLIFLGIFVTAAVLIFIFAVPGTQTSSLVLEGIQKEMTIPNVTWPLDAETNENTFMVLQPSHLSKCIGFGFSCTTRPDEVVATNQRCDGVADCGDASDETFCRTCSTGYWCPPPKGSSDSKKTTKNCLTAAQICDGVPHCPGGWDETHFCKETCLETEFACAKPGIKGLQKCLSRDVVCDGVKDCLKGDDEEDCVECNRGSKLCKADGKCIPKSQLCDGKKDCSDGSDEHKCDCVRCSGGGKTLCDDGTCIMSTQVCDGIADCTNGVDELMCINRKPDV